MPLTTTTLAIVSTATAIIGAGVSAYGMVAQGQQQSAAAKSQSRYAAGMFEYNKSAEAYNKQMGEYNAEAIEKATQDKINQQRARGLALLSSQRAGYGAAGVTLEGTPLAVMDATADEFDKDISNIKWSGDMEAWKIRSRVSPPVADVSGMYTSSMSGAYIGAGSTLLTGIGSSLLAYGKIPKIKSSSESRPTGSLE